MHAETLVLKPLLECQIRPVCKQRPIIHQKYTFAAVIICGPVRPYTLIATDLHTCI